MTERINGRSNTYFSVKSEVAVTVDDREFTRPVSHNFLPLVGNVGVITETIYPSETFELLVTQGKINEEVAADARYDSGRVMVRWSEPDAIFEFNEEKGTLGKPRGHYRSLFIGALQNRYPTILGEWSDAQRVADHAGTKLKQPSDIELAKALLNNHKPAMELK